MIEEAQDFFVLVWQTSAADALTILLYIIDEKILPSFVSIHMERSLVSVVFALRISSFCVRKIRIGASSAGCSRRDTLLITYVILKQRAVHSSTNVSQLQISMFLILAMTFNRFVVFVTPRARTFFFGPYCRMPVAESQGGSRRKRTYITSCAFHILAACFQLYTYALSSELRPQGCRSFSGCRSVGTTACCATVSARA